MDISNKNTNSSPRKTVTTIPLPNTLTSKPISKRLHKSCLTSKADSSNNSNSIAFRDGTHYSDSSNGISEGVSQSLAYVVEHQIVHLASSRDVTAATSMNVSRARQDARVHIFTAALLEHICHLYEPNPYNRKRVLQELCSKLTEREMLSPIAFLDIFTLWREKYITGFSELMRSTVELVGRDATLTVAIPPTYIPMNAHHQLSLITKPSISMLMRTPSDPRSSFFSSRYSNDFNEIKSIGSGGFGSVFKVRNSLDEMLYAVKKVRLKRLTHEKCKKLLREVKVLATLNHSSIVRYNSAWLEQESEAKIKELSKDSVDGSSSEDKEPIDHDKNHAAPFQAQRIVLFIQMELCHCNLHNWLAKRNKRLFGIHSHTDVYGHVHESENMHFIRQLLNGLDYVHTQGIIHRDIKTRNIFIGAHGALKIGDFGLARDVVASPSPTLAAKEPDWDSDRNLYAAAEAVDNSDILSKGIGTSVYSSPEQQSERTYDSKTDIYSAGIIVFELYCPFSTEMERYEKIKNLRKSKSISDELLTRWVEQMNMLTKMVDLDPTVRPSARTLLSSELYLDKDQIISHLESRVEELESRGETLRRENRRLQESLQLETGDYQLFLRWKKENMKPDN